MTDQTPDFKKSIEELEEINQWFQEEDIDLDEGLKKLRRGKDLIKLCRERLKKVENEFVKIKEEFNEQSPEMDHSKKTDTGQNDKDLPF